MIFGGFLRVLVKYLLQNEVFSVIFEDFEDVTVRSEYLIFIKPVWLTISSLILKYIAVLIYGWILGIRFHGNLEVPKGGGFETYFG